MEGVSEVPYPVAIIGMGMRLPGGVRNGEQLWEMLVDKRDGLCQVPQSRYNVDAFYNDTRTGTVKTRHGYFLQEDLGHFDTSFFSIGKYEAAKLDPQQRMLMEVIWECMEGAGQTQWVGTDIGCFVGVFGEDWQEMSSKDTQQIDRYHVLGTGDFAIANRVSYEYDLKGPSITFRTACSSSLVALHNACQALYSGECASAIVAGTNLILTPTMTTSISDNMVLSPSGLSKTFDANADGYGRGEAINAVYIKPLQDAIQQGDPIHAVIRSSAVNCDGRTPSITTPGSEAQEKLIRRAYQKARIQDISQTAFFECHGTGTIAGDTAETSVVAKLFKNGVYIGAIKPNVGHSEGASGLTSIIKAALALSKKVIPPNAHFVTPNPDIPFQEAMLKVPVEPMPWPTDRCQRVSVNSFGIGGTNAHVILESPPIPQLREADNGLTGPRVLVLSAKNKKALEKRIDDLRQYISSHATATMSDLTYTLSLRREHMEHRAFAILEPNGKLSTFERSRVTPKSTIFVFTGQGAQWLGMGKELMSVSVTFLKTVRMLDEVLQTLKHGPKWTLEGELLTDTGADRIHEAEFAQPLSTAVQIALVDVFRELGVHPTSVIGHSSGEIAAAYASGAINAGVAIAVSYYRGLAMKESTGLRPGAMAVVGLGPDQVRPYLREGVTIACENSPQSITLSGDEDRVLEALSNIQTDNSDTFHRLLQVPIAYHSHHMESRSPKYADLIRPIISYNESMVPLYSTVIETAVRDPLELDAAYWCKNLTSPVRFNQGIQRILRDSGQGRIFLEIGPHSTLSSPIRQILHQHDTGKTSTYIPTLIRNEPQWQAILKTAGRLHINGAPVDFSVVNGATGKVTTDLPSYPWIHEESYWSETRLVQEWRQGQEPHHELLGSRCLDSSDIEPSWRNVLSLNHVPWLFSHVIGRDIVFPCAGYIAMAGEAVRQITGSKSYTVSNLFMKSALSLRPSEAVEMITSLHPRRLTDNADSAWYTFTISSFQDGVWQKHCGGQVCPGHDQPAILTDDVKPYERLVSANTWYRMMKKRGLNFGLEFQRLEKISASVTTHQAAALISDRDDLYRSDYTLHPVEIDQSLQILGVAVSHGVARKLTQLCIPTAIERISVAQGQGIMSVAGNCDMSGASMIGNSRIIAGETVVLSVKNALLFAVNDDEQVHMQPMISTVDWKPHMDFLSLDDQLCPLPLPEDSRGSLDKLSKLVILEASRKTRDSNTTSEHLSMYQYWITSQASSIQEIPSSFCRDTIYRNSKPSIARAENNVNNVIQGIPQVATLVELAQKVMASLGDILESQVSPQDVLDKASIDRLYHYMSMTSGCGDFYSLLGHSMPQMRVLQVGTGNGLVTALALRGLTTGNGIPLYSSYTIIDTSAECCSASKEKFSYAKQLNHAVVDISQGCLPPELNPESFELVIASETLARCTSLSKALQNIRQLLVPGGRLLYNMLGNTAHIIPFIMGVLPGWTFQNDSGQEGQATLEEWRVALSDADLIAVGTKNPECRRLEYLHSMVAFRGHLTMTPKGRITLLYLSKTTRWAQTLAHHLVDAGYEVHWCQLGQEADFGTNMISVIDLEGPFFAEISSESFNRLQEQLYKIRDCRVLWVTRCSQMACTDPRYGLVQGFARTIRHELVPEFATVEVDELDDTAASGLVRILHRFNKDKDASFIDPDYKFSLQKGLVYVGRTHWHSMQTISAGSETTGVKTLGVGSYGLLSSLSWLEQPLPQLKENDVAVEMKYIGLNFRDMMVAMGVFGDQRELGVEGSGIISQVGPLVKHLKVGDPVIVAGDGLFTTRKVISQDHCVPLFPSLSLQDGATISGVYGTVFHSLMDIGRLRKGQSVLIHSACGGVGLAAIQVCQMVGAKIFATVGNQQKVQYLIDNLGIPRAHIFDSRSPSFFEGLMEQTDHQGVDIVLNSLSGELLHLSWKCVAKRGKMIELGKRDILGHGMLNMDHFSANRSFIAVDMKQLIDDDPGQFREMIQNSIQYFMEGKIQPIKPVTVFDAANVAQAFYHMQTGQHMGKVVVKIPEDLEDLPVSSSPRLSLPSDGSYLLVGGLGGLGRAVATWMVEKGARHLVFFSRSAGTSEESQAFMKELKSQNCRVTAITGSVDNLYDTRRAVAACQSPIKGVIQMSMILRDALFSKMTHEEWQSVLAPKVAGTWNLHHALHDIPLQFFVTFSSISGVCGHVGQANYAAANSFLGGFVRYRHSLGLPASVIDVGLMEDVGYVYESAPKILQRAQSASVQTVKEHDLLQSLELAISGTKLPGPNHITIGLGTTKPISDPGVVPLWGRDGRYSLWSNILLPNTCLGERMDDDLRDLIESIQQDPDILDDPSVEYRITKVLGREIGPQLANTSEMEEDEIFNMVIESLVMIEVRSWFRRCLRLEVPLADISKAATIRGLGQATIKALRAKYQTQAADRKAENPQLQTDGDQIAVEDAELGRSIQPSSRGPYPQWDSDSEGHVLITGTTGFVGAFLLSILLDLPQVKTVTCLVRAADVTAGKARLREAFNRFALPMAYQNKIVVLAGDSTDPTFGLSPDNFNQLARKVSAIFHLGAAVNYALPYLFHRPANVLGLVNILHFAAAGRQKVVHYFSSTSAYGPSGFLGGSEYISENERPVMVTSGRLQHQVGYSLSKCVAENIVWDAISNGFPVTIYRPGFVLGHSKTGIGNPSGGVDQFMSTCIRLGTYPIPPKQRNSFVPVDFVCTAAIHISRSNKNIRQAYNLVHPQPDQNLELSATLAILSQFPSPPLHALDISEWTRQALHTKNHQLEAMAPLWASRPDELQVWWNSGQESLVTFGTENVHRALKDQPHILCCPDMRHLLELYFMQWSKPL